MRKQEFEQFLTVAEIAEILRVSPPAVRRLIRGRQLPGIRVGDQFRIPLQGFVTYLANLGLDPSQIYRETGKPATAAPPPASPTTATNSAAAGAIVR
jgi:excisionase family DNA binding protein